MGFQTNLLEAPPLKFFRGRTYTRVPLLERLAAKVNYFGPAPKHRPELGPCWEWMGCLQAEGYGQIGAEGKRKIIYTHRVAYEAHFGTLPDHLTLDHLCRNPKCCNPMHLEAVTQRENNLRGNTASTKNLFKTHCNHGHEFTPENTRLRGHRRECKQCEKDRRPASYSRNRENILASQKKHRDANLDEARLKARRTYERNRVKRLAYQKEQRLLRGDEINARKRELRRMKKLNLHV